MGTESHWFLSLRVNLNLNSATEMVRTHKIAAKIGVAVNHFKQSIRVNSHRAQLDSLGLDLEKILCPPTWRTQFSNGATIKDYVGDIQHFNIKTDVFFKPVRHLNCLSVLAERQTLRSRPGSIVFNGTNYTKRCQLPPNIKEKHGLRKMWTVSYLYWMCHILRWVSQIICGGMGLWRGALLCNSGPLVPFGPVLFSLFHKT